MEKRLNKLPDCADLIVVNDIWKDKTNVALIHMEKFFSNTEFNASLCNIYNFQRIMQMRWPMDRCLFYCNNLFLCIFVY